METLEASIGQHPFLKGLSPEHLKILLDSAMAFSTPTDYKALVCVFLGGGNDANNLIIPTAASEYANYATVRTPVLALPNADGSPAKALQLTTSGGGNYIDAAGHEFGLNPAMFEIAQMFNQNSVGGYDALGAKAAVVLNSGPLVFPMTKAQYLANSIKKPPQLFSHADQVTQWQTSIPDQPPSTGWGGASPTSFTAPIPSNWPPMMR